VISLRETLGLFKRSLSFSALKEADQAGRAPHKSGEVNVLVIDNIGMLPLLYRYATIAYVGGGFVDDGVHNVMEAAVYGKPVVYGPVIEEYPEAMELVECGGGVVIDSALEAEDTFNRLLTSPEEYAGRCEAARNYVYSKTGATERIMQQIQEKRLLTN
jgi:3-deoxy-D-manno-octulosonic-acid transferase